MTENTRLKQQMHFIVEIDKLKQVLRQTYTTSKIRRENSCEHSWHIAMMAIIFQEYARDTEINLFRTIKMLLIHDIVEIDTGDTFLYDQQVRKNQHQRETKAAERIFSILPLDQKEHFQSLWNEFEECQTSTAKFANALDRLQPIINNYFTDGKAWRKNNVTRHQIETGNIAIANGAPQLWLYAGDLIKKAVKQGILKE